MRKGFSATLATVAFAVLGFHAMALAPVISQIPDIIIGDGAEDVSPANVFVFADVFDLHAVVRDDDTTPGGIMWTYWVDGGGYRINDADPLPDPETIEDDMIIVQPDPERRLELSVDPYEDDLGDGTPGGDGLARTITIRDITHSPLPHQAAYPDPPGGPGIIQSAVVWLYASDGGTVSVPRQFVVYTDDDGWDVISGRPPAQPPILTVENPGLWESIVEFDMLPHNVTFGQPGGSACFTVAAAEDKLNFARYMSPYGLVELTDNTVYEARLQMSTTNVVPGTTPMWSFLWDNFNHDDMLGALNEFGGEYHIYDNVGGANSLVSEVGRQEFSFLMMPPQGLTPQFRSESAGMFRPDLEGMGDLRLNLRLFDVDDSQGNYGGSLDAGTICMDLIEVYSYDLDYIELGDVLYEVDDIASHDPLTADSILVADVLSNSSVTFADTNLTIGPATPGSWDEIAVIDLLPGNGMPVALDPAAAENNFPVMWMDDEIYMITYELSAPSVTDEQNPPDVLMFGADTPTIELTMMNYIVPNAQDTSQAGEAQFRGISMPRFGAPQQYVAFFTSHSRSDAADDDAAWGRWRPRMQILNTNAVNPGGRVTNLGAVTIHSVKVQKVNSF